MNEITHCMMPSTHNYFYRLDEASQIDQQKIRISVHGIYHNNIIVLADASVNTKTRNHGPVHSWA